MRLRPQNSHSTPRRRVFRGGAAAAALALLAACGSAPVVRLHTLMPAEVTSAAAGAASFAFVLAPVGLPAQVDQPQWLVRLGDGTLAILEQDRWASPLRDEFRQALLEQLIVRHGGVESRSVAAGPVQPLRIVVDVRRFESVLGREAWIEGAWMIAATNSNVATMSRCDWTFREAASGATAAIGAAHRRALARLGDALAAASIRVSRGEPAGCPPSAPRDPA